VYSGPPAANSSISPISSLDRGLLLPTKISVTLAFWLLAFFGLAGFLDFLPSFDGWHTQVWALPSV
jgi:hypothetical protein